MIQITQLNAIYSDENVLEVDKVGITLKNTNKKGSDAVINLIIREKKGQDLLMQDFDIFIGENKTTEFIIPLDVPIPGNFACEIKVSIIVDGKVATESEWEDLISIDEDDSETIADKKFQEEDTEITVVDEKTDFDEEEDTQTEVLIPNQEEINNKRIDNDETEDTEPLENDSSWGVLLEEGQNEIYEEKIEGEISKEDVEEHDETPLETLEEGNEEPKTEKIDNNAPIEEEPVETNEIEETNTIAEEDQEETPTPYPLEFEKVEDENTPLLEENNTPTQTELTSDIEHVEEEPVEKSQKPEKKKKKKSPVGIIIVLFIVIVLGVLGYLNKDRILPSKKGPVKTQKQNKPNKTADIDSLFQTDQDKKVEKLINLDEGKKYSLKIIKLPAEKVDMISNIIEQFNANVKDNGDGTFDIEFSFKNKDDLKKTKEILKSKQIPIK